MNITSGGATTASRLQVAEASRAERQPSLPGRLPDGVTHQPGQAEGVAIMRESRSGSSPLRAYLATALTGLSNGERRHVSQVSDLASAACAEFGIELYEPRKVTDPVHHPEVPDQEVFRLDRQHVTQSDLLIYLADFPSTGAGQELVFAYEALIPIIVMASAKTQVSRMVTGIPGSSFQVRYNNLEELSRQLFDQLESLLPILKQRHAWVSRHKENHIGQRIRQVRLSKGLTHDDLAQAMGTGFFSASQIEQWEHGSDLENNLGIVYIREIAKALSVDLGDLLAGE